LRTKHRRSRRLGIDHPFPRDKWNNPSAVFRFHDPFVIPHINFDQFVVPRTQEGQHSCSGCLPLCGSCTERHGTSRSRCRWASGGVVMARRVDPPLIEQRRACVPVYPSRRSCNPTSLAHFLGASLRPFLVMCRGVHCRSRLLGVGSQRRSKSQSPLVMSQPRPHLSVLSSTSALPLNIVANFTLPSGGRLIPTENVLFWTPRPIALLTFHQSLVSTW